MLTSDISVMCVQGCWDYVRDEIDDWQMRSVIVFGGSLLFEASNEKINVTPTKCVIVLD